MRRREHQSGFSTSVILLVVLVVAVLTVTGLVVYQHHKPSSTKSSAATGTTQTTTQPTTTTTTQPAQSTTQLATHTSTAGNFTFSYPSNWSVTEGLVGSQDEITVRSTSATTANTDTFVMTMWVTTNQDATSVAIKNGTVQKLTNGINLWTIDSTHATSPTNTSGQAVCPEMDIINAAQTHSSYALANGKYLVANGGYCETQRSVATQSYAQQLASSDWQAAVAIIQSIKFN